MVINIDKEQYNKLTDSEKRVIDYLDANKDNLSNASITMIANKTFTSAATVSRAINKIGYAGGISQLRYEVLKQTESLNGSEERNLNKVLAKSFRECSETIDDMVVTDVLKVIEDIKNSKRIVIVALGTSALIAKIFQEQLIILGYTPILIDDTVWLKNANLKNSSDDLVIVLTEKFTEENLLFDFSLRMKKNGAKLVVCTCKKNTKLTDIADTVIYGHSEDTVTTGYLVNTSRIPLLIITRTIVEYLAQ